MKIAINAVRTSISGGHKTYSLNIINHLTKIDDKNKYYIYVNESDADSLNELPNNYKKIIVNSFYYSTIGRLLWIQVFLPVYIKLMDVDILVSPLNISPLCIRIFNIKSILVNHLNLPWIYPDEIIGSKIRVYFLCYFMERSVSVANKVIVDSENAKQELIELLSIDKKKVVAIHLGIDNYKFNTSSTYLMPKELVHKYSLEDKYILYIANSSKHHNFIRLLQAYRLLKGNRPNCPKLLLQIQITDKKHYNEVIQFVYKNKLDNDVSIICNLKSELLPILYNKATLYVFPSYCEVFGFTPLEAMACGTPVVTSMVSAMPEICGDAAIYFDPFDPYDITKKIDYLLNDLKLQDELVEKGFKRVNYFSWNKTAKETLDVLKEVYYLS